ncbi:MAG: hypothetical protein AMS20_00085 [Gemmatimonas sp. SG8_28]|nr:MAG: hypothetical protein AMS20_00085 [Gemmatimonas sp. SG8_28]
MSERGQTPFGGLPLTLVGSTVALNFVLAVQESQHLIDERAVLQWIVLGLTGALVFFLRRILRTIEKCEREAAELRERLIRVETACGMRHPPIIPSRLDRED